MRVRLISRTANSRSRSSSAPVRSPTTATSEVLSLPVGAGSGPGGATSTNRVTAPGRSALSSASAVSPYRSAARSEEHTSELQSRQYLVCRLLLQTQQLPHYYSI